MVQTIVFDFGNVIGFFDYGLATSRLARHSPLSAEAIQRLIYGGDLEDAYESGRMSSADFLRRVREGCGLTGPDEALAEAYVDMFWPNEEVCALVPRLKPRYRLLLGSNTTELHSRHFRRQFAEALRPFDALVLSHEVGARKPRPEFFRHCERLAACPAAACLFIDDVPANVAGARACGWQGIVYRQGDDLARRLADAGVQLAP
jgi:putative hydrolase of the HAD superfamily